MKQSPSVDSWLAEAKNLTAAGKIGMYLVHNGVVRETAKAQARRGEDAPPVRGMFFSYDAEGVRRWEEKTRQMPGISHVRVWLNEGELAVGDDIMYVLVGGDIRPHVIDALQFLVGGIKNECVTETERYEKGDIKDVAVF